MLSKRHRTAKLLSDFNTFQFAGVFGMVVFVVLLLFMTNTSYYHHSTVDLPRVLHPVSMPWANREDTMVVTVNRDGRVYFGVDEVNPTELPRKIADRLKDQSVERKVYIKADMRARWVNVKEALDGVREAGILRVAILSYQRQPVADHL